jgi:RNAse (barnase) inhibitor barstar
MITRHFSDGPSGVYRVEPSADPAALMREAQGAGLQFFDVNCEAVHDKESFLRAIAEALSFPAYFGNNWDALDECLTDLSWLPGKGYVVLLDRLEKMADAAPEVLAAAIPIFADAARYWERKKTRFYVLLSGPAQVKAREQ